MQPAIIESALNGATPKARFPNVPRSHLEIVSDALSCLSAGAAIVHTHVDDRHATAEAAAELYGTHFAPILAERPDAILYPSVAFSSTVQENIAHVPVLARRCGLRVGLVEAGSVNLAATAYVNTPEDIKVMMQMCEDLRLAPSISIYEPGFLRHTLRYLKRGRLPRGAFLKLYMGGTVADATFGLLPTPRMLDVYLEMLADAPLPWSVGVLGGDVFDNGLARYALERGGHLRLGLEDYAGPRRPTNLELVQEAVALCGEVGRPVATCAEAAAILDMN